ncbi:MAG: hypothetical protein EBS38_08670 [Actinobacteria bacterium]|nr:hypothetical protein [Actinomycetota bacterium]
MHLLFVGKGICLAQPIAIDQLVIPKFATISREKHFPLCKILSFLLLSAIGRGDRLYFREDGERVRKTVK